MVKERIALLLKKWHVKKTQLSSLVEANFAGVFDDIVSPLFSTEWGKRASWGVLGFFGILLLVLVIQTAEDWYEDVTITHSAGIAQSSSKDNALRLIAQIPEEHLFGKLGDSEGNLPITSLQLRLVGIIKADPENLSRVIISEAGQPGKVYSIGDSLPSGITVNSIAVDGVVLENGGHMEKLPLQRPPLAFQGMPQSLLDQER